jgi:hypothetical protein
VAVPARLLNPFAHLCLRSAAGAAVDGDVTYIRRSGRRATRTGHVVPRVRFHCTRRGPQRHPSRRSRRSLACDTRIVGEIDPLGTRKDGLDAFLDQKLEEGYTIETRTDTHAIIARRPRGLKRFTSGADPGRYVVEVDEDGIATMRPAEPRRA